MACQRLIYARQRAAVTQKGNATIVHGLILAYQLLRRDHS